ncbi:transglutaminase-like cysteine peptidase [Bradyrhizobium sp. BWA-3-5]|uniref:transglutaminase-like cysteine peptidase n=1 Tax=Bradyrhizobium sp. BWA-3-5 TaxID=3080013 RepID=UPI00293E0E72|nr:transglutaminase-like cysteine peptidase [Bradyrhizobium sp. BWA-3-5]WOH68032.1 transglutaminase-like cysteine peptidase [Bradyrhizobium sp. BWA-3-5]
MTRQVLIVSLLATVAGCFILRDADARDRPYQVLKGQIAIVEGAPTLAPFQHVRFCMRYPSECKSNPAEVDRIELKEETLELLRRVNTNVNIAIAPKLKSYGPQLEDSWKIAPASGDCNDYANTKRHELLERGLPSRALRLSVVKTPSGIGHLVLVVATTRGDLVLDNLTDSIHTWQDTDYQWLKIQSAADARFWYDIRPAVRLAQADRHVRLAGRQ